MLNDVHEDTMTKGSMVFRNLRVPRLWQPGMLLGTQGFLNTMSALHEYPITD